MPPNDLTVHTDSNTCFRGGKLPGMGFGDDPKTGCTHGPNGGSFRVMHYDMDDNGPLPPEFITYTYTQGTPVVGDPEEGSDRGSTPQLDDRCGTQKSLSPRVFVKPKTWYRIAIDVNILNTNSGEGTYAMTVFGCDADGVSCYKQLGTSTRNATFVTQGNIAITQLLMHVYNGGHFSDPRWRLREDGEVILKDLTYNGDPDNPNSCPTDCG